MTLYPHRGHMSMSTIDRAQGRESPPAGFASELRRHQCENLTASVNIAKANTDRCSSVVLL